VTVEDSQIVRRAFGAGPGRATSGAPEPSGGGLPAADPADRTAPDVAGHAAQFADLLAVIDAGREPAVSGESGREALEIVCAVYESARTGRTVALGR
jgi:UDP-N-acetyl-2-amino-2-deoxyglucuronate dehydrogenase